MKKEGKGCKEIIFLSLVAVFFFFVLPSFISANLFSDLANEITGKASSATTTVSITIGADAPNVSHVSLNSTNSIVEGGIRVIEFTAIINDTNGDMNVSNTSGGATGAVTANFSRSGETTRTNSSCLITSGNSSGGNWSCSIGVEFFDASGSWQVSVQATDNSSLSSQNNTRYFTLQQTTSMNMTVSALTFPSSATNIRNITSNNDPITVQNTGNKAYLNFTITGINLLGDTNSATMIPALNFTVSNSSGGTPPLECTNNTNIGGRLVNNTAINIEGANASRGAVAQNNLYICLIHTPTNLISQTYSTGGSPNEDDWTVAAVIGMLLPAGLLSGNRSSKRKRKMKLLLSTLFVFVLLVSSVSAFGVSAPYWGENPLMLWPGESTEVNLGLQNLQAGDSPIDYEVQVELVSGDAVASLKDSSVIDLPFGSDEVPVPLEIHVPDDAQAGDSWTVTVKFKALEKDTNDAGVIQLNTGIDKSFDVVVRGAESLPSKAPSTFANTRILGSIVLIVLALAMLAFLFVKKRSHAKR